MSLDEKLINEVRKYEILYAKNSFGYKNTFAKMQKWQKIAKDLSSIAEDCQRRWRSLRDRYVKETKLRSRAPDICIWEHFEHLNFLKNHIKPRSTKSNYYSRKFFEESVSSKLPTTERGFASPECEKQVNSSIDTLHEQLEVTEDSFMSASSGGAESSERGRRNNKGIEQKLKQTMETFNAFMKTPHQQSTPIANPIPKSRDVAFIEAAFCIINTLRPATRIRLRAESLGHLAQVQLEELEREN